MSEEKYYRVGIEGKDVIIHNLVLNLGTGVDDLKKEDKKKIHLRWIIIPVILFIIITLILWVKISLPPAIYALFIIVDFLTIGWVVSSIQLRFKDKWVSTVFMIILLFVLSVSAGWLGLNEAANAFWNSIIQ